jgi:beta-mannosidase
LYKGEELAAIYQFMFVDSWPAITWSVLDNERKKKPGYLALQQAYQPVLIVASVNKAAILPTVTVTVINDTQDEYRNASLVIKNTYDDRRWLIDDIDIKSNVQSSILTNAELIGLSEYFSLTLLDQSGSEISNNSYLSQDLN